MEHVFLNLFFLTIIIVWTYLITSIIYGGSDQSVHFLIIDLIKLNNHKFLKKIEPFLFGSRMGYPQLLHWVFSFLNKDKIKSISNRMPLLNNAAIGLIHVLFVNSIFLNSNMHLSYKYLLLTSGLLFISSGLFFSFNNAKNRGFSTRGVGIFLVLAYLYSYLNYSMTNSYSFVIASVFAITLMFLVSQFAVQFILFSSIFAFIFSGKLSLLVFPIIGFVVFFLLFRKTAINWLKWQWGHKCLYYKYGAKLFLLNRRESIWRDFVLDFWKIAINNWKKAISYLFYNPVVEVVWGVPILVPFLFYFICVNHSNKYMMNDSQNMLLIFVFSALIVFILTSFKKTRFLGEPERYIDFVISPISIIGALIFKNNIEILIICIVFGFVRISLEYFSYSRQKNSKKTEIDSLTILKNKIDSIEGGPIRLLSNNIEVTKKLLSPNIKGFYGWPIQTDFGKYHFTDIYDWYPKIKDKMIVPLIIEYGTNVVIIDREYIISSIENLFRNIKISILFQDDRYYLLQIIEGPKR